MLSLKGVRKIAIKDVELPQACLHLPLIYRSTPLILWIIEKKQRTRETKYCSVNSQMEFHAWIFVIAFTIWCNIDFPKISCCGAEIWYFVTKIVLTYCKKKLFYWSRKTFEIRGWRPRIFKIFEITRTIFSNSERSEQFLVTECFFNLFLEVSQI